MPAATKSRTRSPHPEALGGVHEFFLGKGLRVLHRENRAAPAVAVCVVYHVGSRNEALGCTGSTHILEHLLFKDSEHFNKHNGREIASYLEWMGALLNASTWFDRTNYFELMPKARVEDALAVEADRMRGSLFNDEDLASEMTVVRNEYERGRNNPFELLDEETWGAAFLAHPYHHPTIGWKEDIEFSTAAKLREFYDRFYHPNNATLILIGDLSLADAKRLSEKYFGAIPRSPNPIPEMRVAEGEQEGARFFELQKPGAMSAVELAYKAPSGTDADIPALIVLAQILAGGLSSRMQTRLVDRGRAAQVSVSAHPMRDPGLIIFTAHAGEGVAPARLLAEMRAECERIASSEPPTKSEIGRAVWSLAAQYAFSRDGMLGEAMVLTEAIATGDWKLAYELPQKFARVDAREVARVAKKYLVRHRETAGILIGSK
ncbi:MAG: M16 family metallopeptidase [Minisyncoccia bacterium]